MTCPCPHCAEARAIQQAREALDWIDPTPAQIDPPEHEQREIADERLADLLASEAPATSRLDEERWHRVAQTERLAERLRSGITD